MILQQKPQVEAADQTTVAVVGKALFRAAELLSISQAGLGKVIGLSGATMSRLSHGKILLDNKSKSWELALLFLRAYRSLMGIVGCRESAHAWLHGHNIALNGTPALLIETTEGLVQVVNYLDAYRGKI